MTIRDIQNKYGGNGEQALRRAIRAELVCGNEVLDTLERVHYIHDQLTHRGLAGQTESREALDAMTRLRDLMRELVKARYQ